MWRWLEILNVFNTLTSAQVFWKTKIFKKLKYCFSVASATIENTTFQYKTDEWEVQNAIKWMGSAKWTYHKKRFLSLIIYFFKNFICLWGPLMNSWFNILTSQMFIFILFGSIWVLLEDVLSLSLSLTIFSERHKTGWVRNATWNLTLSWRRPLSYRNQSIDLQSKSLDWFLHDNGLRHERVKWYLGRLKLYVGLEECLPNTSNVITLVVTTDLLLFRDIWILLNVWEKEGTNEQRRFVCLFHFSRFFRAMLHVISPISTFCKLL